MVQIKPILRHCVPAVDRKLFLPRWHGQRTRTPHRIKAKGPFLLAFRDSRAYSANRYRILKSPLPPHDHVSLTLTAHRPEKSPRPRLFSSNNIYRKHHPMCEFAQTTYSCGIHTKRFTFIKDCTRSMYRDPYSGLLSAPVLPSCSPKSSSGRVVWSRTTSTLCLECMMRRDLVLEKK